MKRVGVGSFAVLFVLTFGQAAFGHGGQYSGPGGSGTGEGFTPSGGGTTGPTGGPQGGTTPGGGSNGGTTPGSGGSGGTSPGGAPTRPGIGTPGAGPAGPAGVGGGTSPGGKKPSGEGQGVTWDAWWFFNDDKYLELKAKVRRTASQTDSGDDFMSEAPAAEVVNRAPAEKLRSQVIPALKLCLQDKFYDARAAASIALGKCGTPDLVGDIRKTFLDEDKRVAESAGLALGLLGSKEAIPDLIEIMSNSQKGRKEFAKDGKDIETRRRGFAALGIGLIGARTDVSDTKAVAALMSQIKRDPKNIDEVVCPIVALGIMKAKEAVPTLRAFLNDEENEAISRSYAATSLGKIGDRSVIPDLLNALKDKQNNVVQSAAIALGALANAEDAEVVMALQKLIKSVPDQVAKNYATIALGEIGGVDNRNFLSKMLDDKSRFAQTFAAIALGVYSTKNLEDKEVPVISDRILKAFKSEKNFEERGAYAIALGLMRAEKAGPDLLDALDKGGQASYRGHLCTALGLMGYRESIKTIEDVVKEKGDVGLRRAASISLGLLGDAGAVKILEAEIAESSNSQAVHGAVTQGLGFIGDSSAVPTLRDMVTNTTKFQDATRAFAAVALGLLADKDEIPLLSKISENNNYHTRTDALGEVLTIL